MAGSKTAWLSRKVLDHANGVAAFAQPARLYLLLSTSAVTEAGAFTELAGGGYARQQVTWNAAAGATVATATLAAQLAFGPATGADWTGIAGWATIDSAAGAGNVYYYGNFASAQTVSVGVQYVFPANTGLTETED